MNNTLPLIISATTLAPCRKNWLSIWKQWVSAPLGGCCFLFNGILILSILCNRHLRSAREYWLTAALAFADFAEGLASFIGAVYRLPYYYSESACYEFVDPLYCMALPHNIIWRWSDTATSFMLVAMAINRLLAVNNPIAYSVNGSRVAIIMIVVVYGISVLCMIYAWIMPIQLQIAGVRLKIVCSTGGLIDSKYTEIIKYATGIGSALSVLIHVAVAFKVRKFMKRLEDKTSIQAEKRGMSKKQIKFTVTSLIKGVCTLTLDSIPRIYGVYAMIQEQMTGVSSDNGGVGSFLFALSNLNGVLNVFIYASRQPEIRKAILSLVGLGHLVDDDDESTKMRVKSSFVPRSKIIVSSQIDT